MEYFYANHKGNHHWHLFDLATALYFIQDNPGYDIARSAFIEGYREFRPLANEELAQLPRFTAARRFTSLALGAPPRENGDCTRAGTHAGRYVLSSLSPVIYC